MREPLLTVSAVSDPVWESLRGLLMVVGFCGIVAAFAYRADR